MIMEEMKQFISLDKNNKLLIKGNAIISEKGVMPSFDGEFVMYGSDVQRLIVLLNEGNYLRRKEICLNSDDCLWGSYKWSTFAILKDEQVAEMLKKQDATIKELGDIEKQLRKDVEKHTEHERVLATENELLKKRVEEIEIKLILNGRDDSEVLKEAVDENVNDSKGVLKRFRDWFKKKR